MTESEARLQVEPRTGSRIVEISGTLSGPRCEFSRTLPAEMASKPIPPSASVRCATEIILLEPCYWTPALPFLYDLRFEVQTEEGASHQLTVELGLRRWSCAGQSFRLESRRKVLRGMRVKSMAPAELPAARAAETALVVDCPTQELCNEASRLGVILIADLRTTDKSLQEKIARLEWSPAVFLALVSQEQLKDPSLEVRKGHQSMLTLCLSASDTEADRALLGAEAVAVELGPSEGPLSWLAEYQRPVIAIRHGESYSELNTTRAACDRLQAELAPEFDLAGYFV